MTVLDVATRTFHVQGHHYALVYIEGLEAGRTYPYSVELNGVRVWPEPESKYPPSVIRTLGPDETLNLVFGSCRVTLPHEPPYTLRKDEDERGFEMDALTALVRRMTVVRWRNGRTRCCFSATRYTPTRCRRARSNT
ncbi:MAG: hypothetical protein WKH64_10525 [Chloroflexia bacterium]